VSTLGSDFDTLLAVYTGASITSLTPIASSDDAQTRTRGSRVQFTAIASTTYQIAVDGFNGDSGDIRLAVGPSALSQLTQPAIAADRSFQLTFRGEAGLSFDIQASTNLTTWTTVSNLLSDGSAIQFVDLLATNFNQRFYRALQAP